MEPATAQETAPGLCICGHEKQDHVTDPLACYGCPGGAIELVHRYTPALAVVRNHDELPGPAVADRVRSGVEQARGGKTQDLGDFSQYLAGDQAEG